MSYCMIEVAIIVIDVRIGALVRGKVDCQTNKRWLAW